MPRTETFSLLKRSFASKQHVEIKIDQRERASENTDDDSTRTDAKLNAFFLALPIPCKTSPNAQKIKPICFRHNINIASIENFHFLIHPSTY